MKFLKENVLRYCLLSFTQATVQLSSVFQELNNKYPNLGLKEILEKIQNFNIKQN